MSAWKCWKCKQDMEEAEDIKIFYKDLTLPEATGYRCPSCGIEFLDADYVVDQLASAEQMLEGK